MPEKERFNELPDHVRDWLEDLSPETARQFERMSPEALEWLATIRPEEVTEIREGVEFIRAVRRMGTFGRWILITAAAFFAALLTIGEGWKALKHWFFG